MNNKGFTLIEILSVLVLIGLLFGLGVPAVSKISQNMKARTYKQKISLIERSGELWGQDNKALLQETQCTIVGLGSNVNCAKRTIRQLIEEDYLDSEDKNTPKFVNPIDDSDLLDYYVYVYKRNNRIYAKLSAESA